MDDEPFDPVATAKLLIRSARQAALGTLVPESGAPFVSLVSIATLPEGAPVLLLSRLAAHTRHLAADPRASLLLGPGPAPGDPLARPRVTLEGRLSRLGTAEPARTRFLRRHREAALYADFADFAFHRLDIASLHLVAGFGRIVSLAARDILIEAGVAGALAGAEEDALAHLNADHSGTLGLYAERLAAAGPGEWRATGLDPEGLDLIADERAARIVFPEPVQDSAALRAVLKALADKARGAAA